MKWEPRKVYLYLVSLVTFIMVLIGSWQLVDTLVEIALPEPEISYPCPERPAPDSNSDAEKEKERCEAEQKRAQASRAVWQKRRLIQNGLFLAIVVPAYLYHWRAARKAEE